ncbi:MAG: hypothetical protein ABIA74_05155 [bacterium]
MRVKFLFIVYIISILFINSVKAADPSLIFHNEESQITMNPGAQVRIGDNELVQGWRDLSIVQQTGGTGSSFGYPSGVTDFNSVYIPKIEQMNIRYDQEYYSGDESESHMTWLKDGFKLAPDAHLYIQIPFPLACPFDLSGGLLELGIDWHLSTSTTICPQGGGGRIQGNGYALILDGNLVIPPGEYLEFTNNTIIDGLGHELILSGSGQLIVDMNTTLSFRNVVIKSLRNIPMQPSLVMNDTSSAVSFQNTKILLGSDYTFTQGYFYIHDDVILSGTSQFIFESNQNLWINDHSTLILDLGCTFSYAPQNGSRNLISMKDQTSFLYLNGATFTAPGNGVNNGIELTKGSLILDNKINLQNMNGTIPNTVQSKAISFGNGTASDDLSINLLASAQVNINGYVDYQNVN